MFNLSRGGVSAPMTNSPQFSATPYPRYTPIELGSVSPRQYSVGTSTPVELNTNTVHGVSPITTAGLPTMSSIIASVNDTNVMRDTPSYVPKDNLGAIDRTDWEDFSDVDFYVANDGKYYSTDPYFNRVIFRESSHVLNPSPTSGHRGPTQFDKDTWERVMPNVPYAYAADPKYAGQAAVALAKANAAGLKRSNLPVNAVTVYGAHNLGLGGISNILKNPDNPLSAVVINNMKDWKKFKKVPQELRDKISNHPESLIGRDYLDYLSYIFSNE